MGRYDFGIDPDMIKGLAAEISLLRDADVQIGIVVGGGNIFRGAGLAKAGLDRVAGDHMGMLATVMNALALKDGFEQQGLPAVVMSGLDMPLVCDRFTQRDAREKIAQGTIVIFAGGTGNPYFTTDTGASLRAIEIKADLLIKATKVDGVYTADPMKDASAQRYEQISFKDAIDQRLAVMDTTAMVMCHDQNLDLVVCSIEESGALLNIAKGNKVGTLVSNSV